MPAPDALARALDLWRRGLSVIPVPRPRPGAPAGQPGDGKRPALAWKAYQTRRPTEAEVCAWFSDAPQNVGIITGAVSGIVVVDADSRAALRWLTRHLPYTPWQVQTARGCHLYYRHPGHRVPNKARIATDVGTLSLDVRGDGGFVIGPGSVHASGHLYALAGDWQTARDALPMFRSSWLAATPAVVSTPPRATARPTGDLVTRARQYLARIPRPEIGQGSDHATLYAAARLVRGFALDAGTALALLEEWAGGRPGWDRAWLARKIQNADRYGSEPIGSLR